MDLAVELLRSSGPTLAVGALCGAVVGIATRASLPWYPSTPRRIEGGPNEDADGVRLEVEQLREELARSNKEQEGLEEEVRSLRASLLKESTSSRGDGLGETSSATVESEQSISEEESVDSARERVRGRDLDIGDTTLETAAVEMVRLVVVSEQGERLADWVLPAEEVEDEIAKLAASAKKKNEPVPDDASWRTTASFAHEAVEAEAKATGDGQPLSTSAEVASGDFGTSLDSDDEGGEDDAAGNSGGEGGEGHDGYGRIIQSHIVEKEELRATLKHQKQSYIGVIEEKDSELADLRLKLSATRATLKSSQSNLLSRPSLSKLNTPSRGPSGDTGSVATKEKGPAPEIRVEGDDGGASPGAGPSEPVPALSSSLKLLQEEMRAKKEKSHRKRTLKAEELVETERSYIGKLKLVVELFVNPLREAIRKGEPILSEAEIQALFSNIETIIKINSVLLEDLEGIMKDWNEESCIGGVFVKMGAFLKIYVAYVNNYMNALQTLGQLGRNKDFQKFSSRPAVRKQMGNFALTDYLIEPVQRIGRYSLFLSGLLEDTHVQHPDHALLKKAEALVKEAGDHVNQSKAQHDNIAKVFEIAQRFPQDCRHKLVLPSRHFKFEGYLFRDPISITSEPKKHAPYFILFNDVVLRARTMYDAPSEVRPDLELRKTIPLRQLKVSDPAIADERAFCTGIWHTPHQLTCISFGDPHWRGALVCRDDEKEEEGTVTAPRLKTRSRRCSGWSNLPRPLPKPPGGKGSTAQDR